VKSETRQASALGVSTRLLLLSTKCCVGPFNNPSKLNHQTTMAEQMSNGDAPINADVEMKEESAAEV
jgi:hypothetical protein